MPHRSAFPQCSFCKHFHIREKILEKVTCLAFPEMIPDNIWANRYDHREPYEGDQSIRFEECDEDMMQARFPDFSQKSIQYEKERTLQKMDYVQPHPHISYKRSDDI